MKKLLSVILSIVVVAAMVCSFAVPAMASISVYSPSGSVIEHSVNDPMLNGHSSGKVNGHSINGSNRLTFSYTGEGTVDSWEIVTKDGKTFSLKDSDGSYRIVEQSGNSVTIEVLDWSVWQSPDGYTVNAIVSGESTTPSTDKDSSSKSPSTGAVTLTFASIAAAGAGAAALTLLKKKDAE